MVLPALKSELRSARERLRRPDGTEFSQSDLAYALRRGGLARASERQVSRWETGAYMPRLDQFAILCRVLRLSADELLGLREPAQASGQVEISPEVEAAIEATVEEAREAADTPTASASPRKAKRGAPGQRGRGA